MFNGCKTILSDRTASYCNYCHPLFHFGDASGWVFESYPRHTQVVKTGSDNSTAKRSATVCNGSLEIPRFTAATLYDTLNDDHECRANDLHLLQRRIHMGENLPSWTVIPKQTKILQ